MNEKKELSQLARQLLGDSNAVKFYTQQEFDEALALGKAEIMTVAIETTKRALLIEREACADLAKDAATYEDDPEVKQAFLALSERILNRIPSQRQ
jgi:hypothetical protein